ncbi:hypothetical protein [Nocardia farcinica]|uniref:hypothetical protein n=1 Tax=Nocardia farcinica TaxID=37329 RepID=UPI002455B39A|nr:hypothetical protein [Nocardia farcinica]
MTNSTTTTLTLSAAENALPGMSNGGFACGAFAGLVGGTATVVLRHGVPLAVPLTATGDGTKVAVTHGDTLLATAAAVEPFVLEPPVRASMDQAEHARRSHPMRGIEHPLSDCVVCGPDRDDGLRVTSGPLPGHPDVLASPFVPTERFAVAGVVRAAAVWGALDCPSYPAAAMRERRFCLLGSLTAHQRRPIEVGEELICLGWTLDAGNRSIRTASAIIDGSGAVVASARAVWVELRRQP